MYRRPRPARTETTRRLIRRGDLDQLRRLLAYVRPYRWHLGVATVGVVFASALGLVFPAVMGDLVDSALGTGQDDASSLDRIALFLVGIFFLQA
jgi:subfamily B ATP-binding cassette protein MsbA